MVEKPHFVSYLEEALIKAIKTFTHHERPFQKTHQEHITDLSKLLEVYKDMKESKIKKMTTVPQLMNDLSPESELVRGLRLISIDIEEEQKISNEEFIRTILNIASEKCQAALQLTTELFSDANSNDYFVITVVPDNDTADKFILSKDSHILRWPTSPAKPWETPREQVLDINNLYLNKK
ncbi:hypothetical protein I4U23_026667 [Adineta vaga]|nr:hypothetical protein I4U23_026667 [Adineta vaga]